MYLEMFFLLSGLTICVLTLSRFRCVVGLEMLFDLKSSDPPTHAWDWVDSLGITCIWQSEQSAKWSLGVLQHIALFYWIPEAQLPSEIPIAGAPA